MGGPSIQRPASRFQELPMKYVKLLLVSIGLSLLGCASSPLQNLNSVSADSAEFLKSPEFEQARLSPDGKYLAVSYRKTGHAIFAILDRHALKMTAQEDFGIQAHIGQFFWASPTRVVIQNTFEDGYLKDNYSRQILFAVNLDGSSAIQIYPKLNSNAQTSIDLSSSYSRFLSQKAMDGRYVFVAESVGTGKGSKTVLRKIDIFSGLNQIVDTDYMENGSYALDQNFRPRAAIEYGAKGAARFYVKNILSNEWLKKPIDLPPGGEMNFLGMDKQSQTLYYTAHNQRGLLAFYQVDLKENGELGTPTEVFSDKDSDIIYVYRDKSNGEPVFIDYGFGFPQRKYLSSSELSLNLQELDKTFPGERVYPLDDNATDLFIAVESERQPTRFYAFDKNASTVRLVLAGNDKIKSSLTVDPKTVFIQARDGVTIPAYIYLPPGQGPFPLIINIHGGPFGVTEEWGYEGYDQFLVNKGYAVMRVNFRGSGGRGLKFEQLGYEHLGSTMQFDIADAAQWAIDQGYTEKGRIGLWGISYGGFSSVMSALQFSELIKCAAGFGGVYDWHTFLDTSDVASDERSTAFWETWLPKGKAQRLQQSPVTFAKDLKVDLFIGHGVDDIRVPVSQARELRGMLGDSPHLTYLEYPETGHWITDEKLRSDYFSRLVSFFDQRLKQPLQNH